MHLFICDVIKVPLWWSISQIHSKVHTHIHTHTIAPHRGSDTALKVSGYKTVWFPEVFVTFTHPVLSPTFTFKAAAFYACCTHEPWVTPVCRDEERSFTAWVKFPKHTHTVSSQLLSLFAATCVSTKCDATLNITLIFIFARRDNTSVCYSPTRHYNPSRYASHAAERSSSTVTFHTAQSW